MLSHLIAAAVGFIAGVLVGHNNKPLVDKGIAAGKGAGAGVGIGGGGSNTATKAQ